MIGPGDYFQAQVNYTEGAVRYAALTPAGIRLSGIFERRRRSASAGSTTPCTAAPALPTTATATCPAGGSALQLTTAWSVQAAYEHFWTPSLRTSLVGAYTDISYNSTARARCAPRSTPGVTGANGLTVQVGPGGTTCGTGSFDWSYWSVSSRTQWNITKDFYVGLEGYYGHLNTMSRAGTAPTPPGVRLRSRPACARFDDQDVFVYRMRVHRDLVP